LYHKKHRGFFPRGWVDAKLYEMQRKATPRKKSYGIQFYESNSQNIPYQKMNQIAKIEKKWITMLQKYL
jgi:hypothetical protein